MIYVDELKEYGWVVRGRKTPNCHLLSDGGLEELHRFANKIGMRIEWFQDRKNSPHYDLTPKRRKLAVEHGAIEITTKEWMKKERTKILMDIMEEEVFNILDPKFASGGIIYPSATTFGSNPPCSLTLKDLENVWKKMNESILPKKLFYENVVNEAEVEILLPDAIDIKKDKNGKVLSFMCWGVHFTATQYCPKGSILSWDIPKFKLNLKE